MKIKAEQTKMCQQVVSDAIALQSKKKDQIEKEGAALKSGSQKIAPGVPIIIDMLPGELEYLRIGAAGILSPLYVAPTNFKELFPIPNGTTVLNALKTAFTTLGIDPSQHPVLVTLVPLIPRPNVTELMNALVSEFNFKSVVMIPAPLLAAIATGNANCIVIDFDGFVSNITPIEGGQIDQAAVCRLDVGATDIKKKLKVKSKDLGEFQALLEKSPVDTFELFFNPKEAKKDLIGIVQCLINIIKRKQKKSPVCIKTLIMCGMYSTFNGIKERFLKDIAADLGDAFIKDLKIISSPLNPNLPLIGGSLVASSEKFAKILCTKDEFAAELQDCWINEKK